MVVCVFWNKTALVFQVAEYRSNRKEAQRAKLAEEQAELDEMYRKQAEEDVSSCSSTSMCTSV